ncbi:MAG: hypothetical protein H6658_11460 [Ardenticatenaceae bacterium]|nr:hypothetical protein [Ardenticatenaceae bacterium]
MTQTNFFKLCANCKKHNPPDAAYCLGCGVSFHYPLSATQDRRQGYQNGRSNQQLYDPPQVNLRELENVAEELNNLWHDFYLIRQTGNENSVLWHVLFKHLAAYQLDNKIHEAKLRIEDIYIEGYIQAHQIGVQRFLSLLEQQIAQELALLQLGYDQELERRRFAFVQDQMDEALSRYLQRQKDAFIVSQHLDDEAVLGRVERFAKAVDHLDQLFIKEGRLGGLAYEDKQIILAELVNLLKAEIFPGIVEEHNFAADIDELGEVVNSRYP